MILQILLPAYVGNEIQISSASTFNAIYDSDWINADKEYKKLCLIAMENMKKPIKIRAYKYFEVNLESFLFVSSNIKLLIRLLEHEIFHSLDYKIDLFLNSTFQKPLLNIKQRSKMSASN